MRKISVLVGLFVLSMTLSTSNLYAACNISNGKIEVSKGGACQSIQTAINKADGVNPVLISVLPGTYTEQVTMKPHVTLVGSGQENTKVTSTALYTLKGADNTTVENIWINSDYVDNTGASSEYYAVLNENTSMNIRNAKVTIPLTSQDYVIGIKNIGIMSITHSIIEIENKIGINGRYGTGIRSVGSATTISDCIINTYAVDALWVPAITGGSFLLRNSVIRCDGSLWNDCVEGNNAVISNSSIEAIGQANAVENRVIGGSATITNSKIILSGTPSANDCAVEYGQVGGSLIQGPICNTPKIVNSWDADFNPIPNQ